MPLSPLPLSPKGSSACWNMEYRGSFMSVWIKMLYQWERMGDICLRCWKGMLQFAELDFPWALVLNLVATLFFPISCIKHVIHVWECHFLWDTFLIRIHVVLLGLPIRKPHFHAHRGTGVPYLAGPNRLCYPHICIVSKCGRKSRNSKFQEPQLQEYVDSFLKVLFISCYCICSQ